MSLRKNIDKFFPRKEQHDTIQFIDSVYKSDNNIKFFLLNLPTGVGKSYLSLLISDWYIKNVDRNAKIDIITNSKILQDQYTETFDCINDLKGKDNYECAKYDCSCQNGAEFNRLNKTKCDWCPYNDARDSFINGRISLTNFYLYILYALYIEKAFEARGSKVLIVDECLHPDTEITMFDGGKKPIKDIKIGDVIKTINEETNEIENNPVVKLHKNLNSGYQMYEIEMDNGDVLKITGNHKVKLITGDWKKVEDLDEEDEILYINEKIESHEFDNRREE